MQGVAASFFVPGIPRGQGSKRVLPNRKAGGRPILVESSKYVGDWRADVQLKAQSVWNGKPLLAGPVAVDFLFIFRRPQSHHVASNRERPVKENAPRYHTSKPDLDKLIRAINDALTGVILTDDCLVARIHSE